MKRTIQLLGFNKNDEMVFTSLLSLLSNKTEHQWDVVPVRSVPAEVLIVDVDSIEGAQFIKNQTASRQKIIHFGHFDGIGGLELRLNKPMRAAGILRCLAEVSKKPNVETRSETRVPPVTVASPEPIGVTTGYRLKRWPEPSILKETPGATRICAIMLKRVVSVDEISEMAGINTENVHQFITNCSKRGYLDIKQRVAQMTTKVTEPPKRRGNPILEKLRMKFGVRSSV
ncbi:hypothetical protein [Sessilibacter sp. MAH4]